MFYEFFKWVLFFYIYCFFGWCFESAFVSVCQKKLVNRGFMKGPLLPIYGFGAVIMLFVTRLCQNILQMYLAGAAAATVLEFFTGMAMEKLFKIRYWDYSKKHLNFKGHICLSSSIAWGFFALVLSDVIHPPIRNLVEGLPPVVLPIAAALITIPSLWDFVTSFKTALNIRDWHVKFEKYKELELEKHKENMELLYKRIEQFAGRDKIRMLKRNPTRDNILLSKKFEKLLKELKNIGEKREKK